MYTQTHTDNSNMHSVRDGVFFRGGTFWRKQSVAVGSDLEPSHAGTC